MRAGSLELSSPRGRLRRRRSLCQSALCSNSFGPGSVIWMMTPTMLPRHSEGVAAPLSEDLAVEGDCDVEDPGEAPSDDGLVPGGRS